MSIDMSQYMDVFLDESKEHLASLNQKLLELEKNTEDIASLNEIFRAAHTLKGMSSTMGFEDVADLTHHMENLLTGLKDGVLQTNSYVIDALFKCFDRLQSMVESLETEGQCDSDNSDLIEMLEMIQNGNYTYAEQDAHPNNNEAGEFNNVSDNNNVIEDFELNDYDWSVIEEAHSKGYNSFSLKIDIAEECLMKAVRAFMVFKALEENGEIIKSIPPVQDLEEGQFDQSFFLLVISSSDLEALAGRLKHISEVTSVEIKPIISRKDIASPSDDVSIPVVSNTNEAKTEHNSQEDDHSKPKVRKTIRVDIERLDNMMNLVGELVMHKGCLQQIGATSQVQNLNETIEQIDRISSDLQALVMKVRMVPIATVFNRFPRMVRDLAKELNKEIEFIVDGKETELDRTVIDEIGDPLVHILRNAIDHGIENPQDRMAAGKPVKGTLKLTAKHEGNNVFIDIQDDGQGINTDRVVEKAIQKGLITSVEAAQMNKDELNQIIFTPGFSTASEITDISGRGVGLDVVKTKIESLNGEVTIESRHGQGTRFRIKLPLTLAIIQALMVAVRDEIYAIPLSSVNETTMLQESEIKLVQNQEVMMLRGAVLPLYRLGELLDIPGETNTDEMYVVVVRKGDHQIGLIVDTLIGQQEIVIKSLGKILTAIPGIAGAIVAGDGNVRLILDISTLF